MDLSTDGPSGIGSGGTGSNAWIAYASAAGNWFANALAGDIAYRNASGRLLFGNTGGDAAMAISGNNIGIGTSTPSYKLDVSGSGRFTNGLTVTGSLIAPTITGSLQGTASWANNAITASYITASNVYGPYGANSVISASYALSSSQTVSASYALTASYVNTLNQGVIVSGALRLDPTADPSPAGNTFTSSSFLFQSSSNTSLGYDLYFRQDGNLVKWKWIEGELQTGLLYGGVLSYSGSKVYISSGSGIIVNYNASTGSEINPQLNYVTWQSQSLELNSRISSSQSTYVHQGSLNTTSSPSPADVTTEQESVEVKA